MPTSSNRVLIIGAGPTGTSLALLLAELGIATTLIERRREPQSHPAASILNTRTMEIFRQLGIEQEIMADCQEVFHRSNISWVTSLTGRHLGQLSAVQEDLQQQLSVSPTHAVHYPQNRLEGLLWRRVRQSEWIDFRPGCRCTDVTQTENGVVAMVQDVDLTEASRQSECLNGAYLVACDGGDSRVRQGLNIHFEGPLLQNMIGIHFEADLGPLVDHRRSILYWLFHPNSLGVLIAHWTPTEWVLFFPYFPPHQSVNDFDQAEIRKRISAAVGWENIPDLVIHKTLPWQMTARLASQYRIGRCFLAGDAAHTFPPTGGLGLNTGVQDAHNLAWKLAAVLSDASGNGSRSGTIESGEKLLSSYESERRPVAQINRQQSVDNYLKMNDMIQVVGLEFRHIQTLRTVQESVLFRCLPQTVQKQTLLFALRMALRRLRRLDSDGPDGDRLRNRFAKLIPGQAAHYRGLGLDLGFCYGRDTWPAEESTTRYESALRLGGRLPHLPVHYQGQLVSTLDLVPQNGFRILTTPDQKDGWLHTIGQSKIVSSWMADPVCLAIGGSANSTACTRDQFAADAVDDSGQWSRWMGPSICGVLVRPDGHIAWLPESVPSTPPTDWWAPIKLGDFS